MFQLYLIHYERLMFISNYVHMHINFTTQKGSNYDEKYRESLH